MHNNGDLSMYYNEAKIYMLYETKVILFNACINGSIVGEKVASLLRVYKWHLPTIVHSQSVCG